MKGDIRRDEDLVKYMSNVIKEKDDLIEKFRLESAQMIVSIINLYYQLL